MKNLIAAVLKVMAEVEQIDKNLTVGEGKFSYKGVADKDVKRIIGKAMVKHGLIILPIGIEKETRVDRWTEGDRTRQSVFSEVITKYRLCHDSGESIEIVGYGHGVDSQDKAAGKCTTYALKYTLLYTFLVETGLIDDADTTHSNSSPTPKQQPQSSDEKELDWLNKFHPKGSTALSPQWLNIVAGIEKGTVKSVADVRKYYKVNKEVQQELENELKLQK